MIWYDDQVCRHSKVEVSVLEFTVGGCWHQDSVLSNFSMLIFAHYETITYTSGWYVTDMQTCTLALL
jgi:hypothetical protein